MRAETDKREEQNHPQPNQHAKNIDAKEIFKRPTDEEIPKNDKNMDKLEFLFSRQKRLISQDVGDIYKDHEIHQNTKHEDHLSSINLQKKNQEEVIEKKQYQMQNDNNLTPPHSINNIVKSTENKMKNLYQMQEPFSGYKIFMLSSALLHEVVELQRETNWKWWKTTKDLDNENIQEEVIDLWHFLIQLSIEVGLDPDIIVQKYIKKNKENLERQKRGY